MIEQEVQQRTLELIAEGLSLPDACRKFAEETDDRYWAREALKAALALDRLPDMVKLTGI